MSLAVIELPSVYGLSLNSILNSHNYTNSENTEIQRYGLSYSYVGSGKYLTTELIPT